MTSTPSALQPSTKTPSVVVIGAGAAAVALAGALHRGSVQVHGLWARRAESTTFASTKAGVPALVGPLPPSIAEANAILLAVRDDAISSVATQLVDAGVTSKSQVILHCSGALSSVEAFADVAEHFAGTAMLHPLRAISRDASAIDEIPGTFFGIQGDTFGAQVALALCTAMGGRALRLSEDHAGAYHAGCVMASNYLVPLLALAAELLQGAGITKELATEAVTSLAAGSLANIQDKGIPDALTGPIRRGDVDTVRRNLAALRQTVPEAEQAYRILGEHTTALAKSLGTPAQALEAITLQLSKKPE